MFIFSKLFSLLYLGQIWSENLKFFKLTDIWYGGRWPCAYLHFNVYFFKIVFVHILGKFGPKIWSSSDWLKFCTEIGYHILISILMFIFSKLFSLIYLGQIWSRKWTSSNWMTFGTEVDDYVLISIFNAYFLKIFFWFMCFLANLVPKSEHFQIDWNLLQRQVTIYLFRF